jgi:hypothetical protein
MAESTSDDEPIPFAARNAVTEASLRAVGLLGANYDADPKFCRQAAHLFLEGLEESELIHLVAVQSVWLLEQMEYIERCTNGEVPVAGQIQELGLHVAQKRVFDET